MICFDFSQIFSSGWAMGLRLFTQATFAHILLFLMKAVGNRRKLPSSLREAFNKKNILFMEFSIRGGVYPLFHNFFLEKDIVFKRISKDAQKLLIHPEM